MIYERPEKRERVKALWKVSKCLKDGVSERDPPDNCIPSMLFLTLIIEILIFQIINALILLCRCNSLRFLVSSIFCRKKKENFSYSRGLGRCSVRFIHGFLVFITDSQHLHTYSGSSPSQSSLWKTKLFRSSSYAVSWLIRSLPP